MAATILSKGQIKSFFIIARCCWATRVARYANYLEIGDKSTEDEKSLLELLNAQIKMFESYDPTLLTNCLSYDDMLIVLNYIMKKLGMCFNTFDLPVTA